MRSKCLLFLYYPNPSQQLYCFTYFSLKRIIQVLPSSLECSLVRIKVLMPKLSGLDVLHVLSRSPKIIFTTAYSEYAIESYDYDAIDYLLKPIDFQRFLKAVTKAQRVFSSYKPNKTSASVPIESDKTIYIKSGPQLHKVNMADILYLEKEGNYLTFHTRTKKIVSRQNMKDISEILDPGVFVRVHKSYVVALQHLEIIESHQVTIGSATIPVDRNYREDFLQKINKSH